LTPGRSVRAVFQPLIDLDSGDVLAHEAPDDVGAEPASR
jgi:hypothetical protein